jgi:hypothetical protein
LEAADSIGADRIRVIDPRFGKDGEGVDLRGFEVPLYRSPSRGEVDPGAVGIDPAKAKSMIDSGQAPAEPVQNEPPPAENQP